MKRHSQAKVQDGGAMISPFPSRYSAAVVIFVLSAKPRTHGAERKCRWTGEFLDIETIG